MTGELAGRLAGLQRAMAAPLPSPEQIAAGNAEDRALAERIHRARPGVPLHHAYAVLDTLRTIRRLDAAAAQAQEEEPIRGANPPKDGPWGDCWCTLPPRHDGDCHCQPCSERHEAPGWAHEEGCCG